MKKILFIFILPLLVCCLLQSSKAETLVYVVDSALGPGVDLTHGKVNSERTLCYGHFSDSKDIGVALPESLPGENCFYVFNQGEVYMFSRSEKFWVLEMYAKSPEELKVSSERSPMYHSVDVINKENVSRVMVMTRDQISFTEYRIGKGEIYVEFWPGDEDGNGLSVVFAGIQFFQMDPPEIILDTVYSHPDYESNALLNMMTFKEELPPTLDAEVKIKLLLNQIAVMMYQNHPEPGVSISGRESKALELRQKLMLLSAYPYAGRIAYVQSQDYIEDAIQVFFTCQFNSSSLPKVFDTMEVVIDHCLKNDMVKQEEIEYLNTNSIKMLLVKRFTSLDALNEDIPRNFIPAQYKKIWKMHLSHGNPKIRFSNDFSPHMGFGNRAYYSPYSNTIYLGLSSNKYSQGYIKDWGAELAHADQWERYPRWVMNERSSNEWNFLDSLRRNSKDGLYAKMSYEELYDDVIYSKDDKIKGHYTIEHEAHYRDEVERIWPEYNEENYWK